MNCKRYSLIFLAATLAGALLIQACAKSPVSPVDEEDDIRYRYSGRTPDYSHMDIYPAVRPNHDDIAFVRLMGTAPPDSLVQGLFLLNLHTLEPQLLIEGELGKPTWFDESSIIVALYVGEIPSGLYILNLNTSLARRIHDAIPWMWPTASANDSLVVFHDAGRIRMLDLTSGETWEVIDINGRTPAWSPTGSIIACSQRAMNGSARIITTITPSGRIIEQLTEPKKSVLHYCPSWDLLESRIVFHSKYPDVNNKIVYDILIMDISSKKSATITKGMFPVFNINGDTIIYSNFSSGPDTLDIRLFQLDLITNSVQQLTY